jgi:hypothetical protein
MKQKRLVLLLISFTFVQYLSGCILASPSDVMPSLTPGKSTATRGNTPSPVLPNTASPIETLTPAPILSTVLSHQDAYKVLQELYEDNGDCQLPCYWKIIPGETLWQDVSTFLSSMGRIYGPGGTTKVASYSVVFEGIDDPIGGIAPTFWVETGVVKAIALNGNEVRQDFDYSLSGLLKEFGEPEEIWIRPIAESGDNQPFYYLVLMYPSKGILVNLLGNAEKQGQRLVVCPQDMFNRSPFFPQLILWNPKEEVTFDEFGKRLIDDDLGWVMDEYRPLQEVVADKLTNMEFYETYSEPNTKLCMNVLPVR